MASRLSILSVPFVSLWSLAPLAAAASNVDFTLQEVGIQGPIDGIAAFSDVHSANALDIEQKIRLRRIELGGISEPLAGYLRVSAVEHEYRAQHCTSAGFCVDMQVLPGDGKATFRVRGQVFEVSAPEGACPVGVSCATDFLSWQINQSTMRNGSDIRAFPLIASVIQQNGIRIIDALGRSEWMRLDRSATLDRLGSLQSSSMISQGVLKLSFSEGCLVLDFLRDMAFSFTKNEVRKHPHGIGALDLGVDRQLVHRDGGSGQFVDYAGGVAAWSNGDFAKVDLRVEEKQDIERLDFEVVGLYEHHGRLFVGLRDESRLAMAEWKEKGFELFLEAPFEGAQSLFAYGYFYLREGNSLQLLSFENGKIAMKSTSLSSLSERQLLRRVGGGAQNALVLLDGIETDGGKQKAGEFCEINLYHNTYLQADRTERPYDAIYSGRSLGQIKVEVPCGVRLSGSVAGERRGASAVLTSVNAAGKVSISLLQSLAAKR